jgi:hypothetical protein
MAGPITVRQLQEALNPILLGEVCGQLDAFIDAASELFYGGERPTVFDQYALIPQVVVKPGTIPNGNLRPFGTGHMGVEISSGLLWLKEKLARDFALGHEMGHGISARVLANIGMTGASGTKTEVVADLLSAYVWYRLGVNWTRLLGAITRAQDQIFDKCQNGDHPAGKNRICYIGTMFLKVGKSTDINVFYQACREILQSLD